MSNEFQRLSAEIGFDELNFRDTRSRVNTMYKRMDEYIRQEYELIAQRSYADASAGDGHRFDASSFVRSALRAYDPLSDFVYEREWIRKRDRLFESIIATERGNQEMRRNLKRGLDVLANQVRQYADNITIKARIEAFHRRGDDMLVWVTEKDEKVCNICGPRDEQIYPIELFPQMPAHWHCRCHPEVVDLEDSKRRERRMK